MIRDSFKGYRCKSDIAIIALKLTDPLRRQMLKNVTFLTEYL